MKQTMLYTGESARPTGLRNFRRVWNAAAREPERKLDKHMKSKRVRKNK